MYANFSTATGDLYIPASTSTIKCSTNSSSATIQDSYVSINISTFSATGLTINPVTASATLGTSGGTTLNSTVPVYTTSLPVMTMQDASATSIGGFSVTSTATVGSDGVSGKVNERLGRNGSAVVNAVGMLAVMLGMVL